LRLIRQSPAEVSFVGFEAFGHIVKEKRNRNIKDPAELEQTRSADSIGASFVLLNLLERQPYGLAQLFLAQTQQRAPQPDTASHVNVDRIGRARGQPFDITTGSCPPLSSPGSLFLSHFLLCAFLPWESAQSAGFITAMRSHCPIQKLAKPSVSRHNMQTLIVFATIVPV
jgi:hypothetical protein